MADSVPGPHGNTLVNKNCEAEVSRRRIVNQAKGQCPVRKVCAHAVRQQAVWIKPGVQEGCRGDLQIPAHCVRLSGKSWIRALNYFFGHTTWHVGFSFLTMDQTLTPCTGNT